MALITVMGRRLYYERYGAAGPYLLYLHGGPGASCLDFAPQGKRLGEKLQVISLDQLGVLRSDAIGENEAYGMRTQIEQLEALRKALGIVSWCVLGHSYGGMLACLYANLYPSSVDAVLYEGPSWNLGLSTKAMAAFLLERAKPDEDTGVFTSILGKRYAPGDIQALTDMESMQKCVQGPWIGVYLHALSPEEYDGSYPSEGITDEMNAKDGMHAKKLFEDGEILCDFLPLLKENAQPSLLMRGAFDPVCGRDQQEYFAANAPKGFIKNFENSGHFPRVEEPDAYAYAVASFVLRWGKARGMKEEDVKAL